MQNQSIHMRNPLNALAGVLFVLNICVAQFAIADEDGTFTIASLQGSYAYVNNNSGVASFGPIIFDGKGGLTLKEKVNLPCSGPSPVLGCARGIVDLTGSGTYTVNPDGTGVATITFKDSSNGSIIGPDTFDFMISETTKKGRTLLATQVFAADQSGGLAGQLVAPTWTRISDEDGTFTIESLQGSYAYVNNNSGVASFGPIIFDGEGGLTLKEKVNLPCSGPSPVLGCARGIVDLTGSGTYTVNPDGTGVATITFKDSSNGSVIGPDKFDFMIS